MGMIKPVESVLRLNKAYFSEMNYHRTPEIQQVDLQISFSRSIHKNSASHFNISLSCNIEDHTNNAIKVAITVCGDFQVETSVADRPIDALVTNATAILFPYLRSQILLITVQPDIPPINLPIMNIAEMFTVDDK